MQYRRLGNTGLMVSEIGLGGEWLERLDRETCAEIIEYAENAGINILDCWMSNPEVRSNIGYAIKESREKWIIQGHIGSTWQNGQYVRSRDIELAKAAFEDLLARFQTDYIDLGMIHYVDAADDFNEIVNGPFLKYIYELKAQGRIRHIGLSTHNPEIAKLAVESGIIEMMLFSVNPAFDMLPVNGDAEVYFGDDFSTAVNGISPERVELYKLCEQKGVGITVMKGYAGGRLFDEKRSPFGVKLSPVQCLHYCLTRPAVASVMVGFSAVSHIDEAVSYETASPDERDYASLLARAPMHAYAGQCTYCGHCKPCPKDIDIAMVNKLYDLAIMQKTLPDSILDHYRVMKNKAGDCIGCKTCESRCPFGVKIAERMKQAAELFGE